MRDLGFLIMLPSGRERAETDFCARNGIHNISSRLIFCESRAACTRSAISGEELLESAALRAVASDALFKSEKVCEKAAGEES